ncbi:N(6)-adenine-specific methyltransferase METTL4 isoform X2 [Artibeus jamaicensis]|uniref:N(6)-adenine-specific methyltransferase METTL4 isoform X2 n=1 Tax=Artibeus jamaicensis TaxID=9417 RepID=UPI00235AFEDA|nr:N(6)-adenine-specific methyltransferase METTL4 isoform X2 [Artibeus jamaicensis]
MSVVHQLSPGWLLDHLSFINKINYQVHQHHEPCCSKNEPTTSVHLESLHVDSMSSFGSSAKFIASNSTTKPEKEDRGNCEAFMQKYIFRPELFDINKPHMISAVHKECQSNEKEDTMSGIKKEISISTLRKKRKRCHTCNQGELDAMEYHEKIRGLILDGSRQIIQESLKNGFLHPLSEKSEKCSEPVALPLDTCNLSELCEMAKHLPTLNETELLTLQLKENDMSVTEQDLFLRLVENNSSFTKIITLMGQKYLVPPKSCFLLSDISCMNPLLNCGKTYDAIVIDPPWQNKSVKRSNSVVTLIILIITCHHANFSQYIDCIPCSFSLILSSPLFRYSYLSPLQIKQIPIPKLAAPNCLVITWVTNRQTHLRFVKEELYPSWSVETVAEWHWLKITNSGEFVFPLDSPHKKPYECLILGRFQEKTALPLRNVLPIPDHKLIVSVPCTLHSHKPPLADDERERVKDVKYLPRSYN